MDLKGFHKKYSGKYGGTPEFLRGIVTAAAAVLCVLLTVPMLTPVVTNTGIQSARNTNGTNAAVMDRYDTFLTNSISDALEGIVTMEKEYWLSDEDIVAPRPNPDCYGETDDPSTLQWLLDDAKERLGLTDTLFSTETVISPGTTIRYYLDDTIFVVCWKELLNGTTYSISEVKIAHPSQFRRFLADGTYGSDKQYLATEMATTVNAVVASSGDFYKYRGYGVVVYNGQVYRANEFLDTCYIDENGDMLFTKRGQFSSVEQAQQFVDENNVRFSLSFGPILVENYEVKPLGYYPVGEPSGNYARAALAQMGELHYLLVTANFDGGSRVPSVPTFAKQMAAFGCKTAYALDGGQTATLVMNNMLFNRPDYGSQRQISDIIYFATAIPED